jgi:hypothetical protein
MTLKEIKAAVDAGKVVCWSNDNYYVEKGGPTGLLVVCGDTDLPLFAVCDAIINDNFFILKNP